MLAFGITINIAVLVSVLLLSFAAGFLVRYSKLSALRKKVQELESEVLNSHAEILELQQAASVQKSPSEHAIPVITLKSKEEKNKNLQKGN